MGILKFTYNCFSAAFNYFKCLLHGQNKAEVGLYQNYCLLASYVISHNFLDHSDSQFHCLQIDSISPFKKNSYSHLMEQHIMAEIIVCQLIQLLPLFSKKIIVFGVPEHTTICRILCSIFHLCQLFFISVIFF